MSKFDKIYTNPVNPGSFSGLSGFTKALKDNKIKICECILNIINGQIKLSKEDFEKLKPYKNLFRKLLTKNTKIKEKKRLIIQKGGFLQILIPAIISGLASIISSAISSNNSE